MIGRLPHLLVIAALLACPPPAVAQLPAADNALEEERYRQCLAKVNENAEAGFERARDWRISGGGIPSRHCAAMALIALQKFAMAAQMLEQIAGDQADMSPELRADVLAQAGQAWIMQGDAVRAISAQTAALKLKPDDPDLLIDRSIGYGGSGRYWEAIDDLNRVIELNPRRADAYVFRASAYRLVDAPELALDDVAEALRLSPGSPDALLERGMLRRMTGDDAGARQDWVQVVRMGAAAGAALDVARANLEKMDVKVEPAPPAAPPAPTRPQRPQPRKDGPPRAGG
ncbi:MAG: tetratricopeptide repeat protein [Alphaproteobacteria bacterium]|nr:tetratricopeptide repeat protein [Alphaproteobacteria bacterium]